MREILVLSRNVASFSRAIQHLTGQEVDVLDTRLGQVIILLDIKYVRFSEQLYRNEGVYSDAREILWVEDPHDVQRPPHIPIFALISDGITRQHLENLGYKFLGCIEDPKSNEYSTKVKNEVFERIG